MKIGCHLSAADGYFKMGLASFQIGANTFQFFTRNPRRNKVKDPDSIDVAKLLDLIEDKNFCPVMAHAPYIFNPCSADVHIREFTKETMADDLRILEMIPGSYYNFHPGCHLGQGADVGISQTAAMLNAIITEKQTSTVLIETMAGKGSEIGRTFEEIRAMLDLVELKSHVGVCLDTCHISDAGYDVSDFDSVLNEFDSVIGLKNLKAIHLNDSKNERGAKKDRHEKLGEGKFGMKTIENIVTNPRVFDLPFYLETPNELEGYKQEIELVKALRGE